MKIVIAGGSGQVGTALARHYHHAHEVTVLTRKPVPNPWRTVQWDGRTLGPWTTTLNHADVLINLAGRSVNCRYNPENRRHILNSRVDSTLALQKALARTPNPPALWLNASTATIYRHTLDRPGLDWPMDEFTGELGGDEPGAPDTWNFSIQVAKAWEQAFFSTLTPQTRKVALRSAMTFTPDPGGVFDVFLSLVRRGLGGTNLPGTQFVSWIHETDFLRAIDFLIATPTLDGPINIASPNPIPNRDFLRILRHAWGTRIGLPTTRTMLEIGTFLLRTESELVLKSRRVIPTRLTQAGFLFTYLHWAEAAKALVASWRKLHRAKP